MAKQLEDFMNDDKLFDEMDEVQLMELIAKTRTSRATQKATSKPAKEARTKSAKKTNKAMTLFDSLSDEEKEALLKELTDD